MVSVALKHAINVKWAQLISNDKNKGGWLFSYFENIVQLLKYHSRIIYN